MSSFPFLPCTDGTPLGLGGAALGHLFEQVPAPQAQALLQGAWDDGCRSFDTAPHYGHGVSERRMGDFLREQSPGTWHLSTKVGRLLTPHADAPRSQHGYVQTLPFVQHWDFSASGMRRSVEDSLQRLGLARLGTVYIHDMDAHTQGESAEQVFRQVVDEALPALQQLKREGLIQHIGLGVNDHAVVIRLLAYAELDALLLAGRYTLLDPSALPVLMPVLAKKNVALALGGVFNSGILAQRIVRGQNLHFNYQTAPPEWVEKALRIQAVCDQHSVPIQAAALQFVLAHPVTRLVLLGARRVSEWTQARAWLRLPIPSALWAQLRHEGLLMDEAPTP